MSFIHRKKKFAVTKSEVSAYFETENEAQYCTIGVEEETKFACKTDQTQSISYQ